MKKDEQLDFKNGNLKKYKLPCLARYMGQDGKNPFKEIKVLVT
jgi:hypothetical protein